MTDHTVLLGEDFPHKVSAEYPSRESAEQAVQRLTEHAQIPRTQINIVQPNDPLIARKLEPEVTGIRRTLARSHLVFGGAGLVLGLVVALILVSVGPVLTRSSPLFTFIVFGFFFTIFGLLLAGLVSLRPDHDSMIAKTRTASRTGQWTVIVHCQDQDQQERAKEVVNTTAETL
ncbi:hypothetical protein [Oceanisphaera avium]|uniref:Riboflavin biosynthesis protein RibA n=1 Tax=Oceanisphaera avium TaxID=1903694 RepID=A0A1Y0CXQ9_9GAMM|nr:hypothetical protein [Oceanisphaera avium]ART80113.1 hypothetical protein CBP12_08105 [Oceanisphaera avium]